MSAYHKVILSLGSNIGDRKEYLQTAVENIHQRIGLISIISSIFETPSWGFESDPFYNIALCANTHLPAQQVLQECMLIEEQMGRTRKNTNGYAARVIDIDLIFFDEEIIESQTLTLPHPLMQERFFVLDPIAEIAPDFKHPILQQTVLQLKEICKDESKTKKIGHLVNPKIYFDFSGINFLAIEGNIGAGKTTLTQKIATDFNAKEILERFADNPFLPKFYEDPTRYAFPLEMSFLADRYSQLSDDLSQFNLFSDFVIADYYIFKSLLFAQVTLEDDEIRLYRNVFDIMYKDTSKPNLYVYLYQDTERLLQNIAKRGRSYEQNIPADYLDKINSGYSEFIKSLPQENVLVIDVTEKDFVENQQDYLDILQEIAKKIKQVD